MRAEKLLEVLMDDKKYKARVEELKALEAKYAKVRQIADTVEKAQQMVAAAEKKQAELDQMEKNLSDEFLKLTNKLNDEVKECKRALDERYAQQMAKQADLRDLIQEARKLDEKNQKALVAITNESQRLKEYEKLVKADAVLLAEKVKKINEVFNG